MRLLALTLMLLAACARQYSDVEAASMKTVDAHAKARLVKLARR